MHRSFPLFSEILLCLILRLPFCMEFQVIPDVNDDDINMKETADFILNELDGHVRTLQLLSFMRLGSLESLRSYLFLLWQDV